MKSIEVYSFSVFSPAKSGEGKTADDLLSKKGDRRFAAVARWHYERCAQKYRLAAAKFLEAAADLPFNRTRRRLESQAQSMLKRAADAEEYLRHSINNFQNLVSLFDLRRKDSANLIADYLNSGNNIPHSTFGRKQFPDFD